MKMENLEVRFDNFKKKLASGALALTLATGALAVAPSTALATTKDIKVVQNAETGEDELRYDVQEGDTVSQISVYLVNRFWKNGEVPKEYIEMFEEEPNTKCQFWPGIVFYAINKINEEREAEGKKTKIKTLHLKPEQDDMPVPGTFEELLMYTMIAKKSGFHARYVQANKIYPEQKSIYISYDEAVRRIQEIFRVMKPNENIELTEEKVKTYLKMIEGTTYKFVLKDGKVPQGDDSWTFYSLVITPEELDKELHKPKIKRK